MIHRESAVRPIDSFFISGFSKPVGSEDREATGKHRRKNIAPGRGRFQEQTSEMGDAKDAGGDEGKGTAVSVEPQLEGRDRAISANGARSAAQTRKNTGNGELDGGT